MVTKLTVFLFVLSILYCLGEGFMFYRAWKSEKNNLTPTRALLIGIALSYIITIIFTGFGI